jgi:hypothetical protein
MSSTMNVMFDDVMACQLWKGYDTSDVCDIHDVQAVNIRTSLTSRCHVQRRGVATQWNLLTGVPCFVFASAWLALFEA